MSLNSSPGILELKPFKYIHVWCFQICKCILVVIHVLLHMKFYWWRGANPIFLGLNLYKIDSPSPRDASHQIKLHSVEPFLRSSLQKIYPYFPYGAPPLWPLGDQHLHLYKIDSPQPQPPSPQWCLTPNLVTFCWAVLK